MTRMSSLRAALAAGVCLLPLQAMAQSDTGFDIGEKPAAASPAMTQGNNWLQLGGQYNSGPSNYLNRFTGANSPGFYGLGDFHVGQRDAWDSGGTFYWEAQGHNFGFDDRSFSARVGQQGTWGLSFSYDGIPYEGSTGFQSVWQRSGATVPGVPGGSLPIAFPGTPFVPTHGIVDSLWLPSRNPSLAARLFDYDIATRRDVFTGTGKYQWGDWTITGAWRHEHKTGYQANSLEIGGTVGLTSAGGLNNTTKPAAIASGLGYFAQPIDYDTDRYDLTAAYGTPRLQVQIGYMFSNFRDNITEFNAQNPFAFGSLSSFAVGSATPSAASLSAPYALPPSNSAHQLRLLFGYNLTPTTRINANFAYGLEMQNSGFISGTGDPLNNPAEPRSSFNGLVQTVFGNVAVTAQPLPKLDVRLAYTIDDRDNQSPRNAYFVDTRNNNSTSANGDCAFGVGMCINLPYSYQHQTFSAEAGYRILPQTKLIVSDTFETTYRNYADASYVTSNTFTGKVRSQLLSDVFGALSYSHQDRNANNYVNNNTWALLGTTLTDPNGFLMYFEASRKHDELKATIDVSPTSNFTATMMLKYSADNYPNGQYGLRSNHNLLLGPDVSWQVTPTTNAHAYYNYQQIFYDQANLYTTGTNFGPTGTGYFVPYTTNTTDAVHTFGATVDWQAIKDVLKFSVEYNFSYGDTAYALGDGMALIGGAIINPATIAGLQFQSMPDVTSMLNIIQIRGEYTFRPNMTMIFGYAYERFSYKDAMYNVSSTTYANAIFPGTLNPNESIHVVGAGLRVRF